MGLDIQALMDIIKSISTNYYKLIYLINISENIKDVVGSADYINFSLDVSKKMLNCDNYADYDFDTLLDNCKSNIIILDNIEVLFLPLLNIDIQRYFEKHSRNNVLIIKWPGKYENGKLIYAEPGHPEFKQFSVNESNVLIGG